MPDISFVVADRSIPGYLAVPQGSPGPWPGVVVIHEAFGLNDDIRRQADEFAASGYLALAPDLFEGRPWLRCVRSAFRQLRAQSGPAFRVLDGARAELARRDDCTGVTGVAGFCMGGGFALLCAPRQGFAAASVNYGEVPQDAERVLAGGCPIVASFGGRDPMGTTHPERLQRALTVLDIPHDVQVYPGSGHRFMSEASGAGAIFAKITRMAYQRADAEDSWQRIFAFFRRYLSAPAPGGQAAPEADRPSSGS
ncbi:MAG: dienelactone hydrolase family protein [Streptosporangiaceae bacterium]